MRGIATGDVFRRLVSRYQYALSTRAGTDSLAALLRAATELDLEATTVSVDGRSAYDSVSRAAIMGKLKEVAPQILRFVRSPYARVSTYSYLWWDDSGRCHEIAQAERGRAGRLPRTALALCQHDALAAAARQLEAGEFLAAFLDDIYVVTSPSRARGRLDAVTATIEREAGPFEWSCSALSFRNWQHDAKRSSRLWTPTSTRCSCTSCKPTTESFPQKEFLSTREPVQLATGASSLLEFKSSAKATSSYAFTAQGRSRIIQTTAVLRTPCFWADWMHQCLCHSLPAVLSELHIWCQTAGIACLEDHGCKAILTHEQHDVAEFCTHLMENVPRSRSRSSLMPEGGPFKAQAVKQSNATTNCAAHCFVTK